MAKKSKNSTLEILIAIFVVIFIFALIGVLTLQPADFLQTGAVVTSNEGTGAGGSADSVEGSPTGDIGTPLNPALSTFEVMPP